MPKLTIEGLGVIGNLYKIFGFFWFIGFSNLPTPPL